MCLVSVILPLYRTAPYLRELHRRLVETLAMTDFDYELLMVDDGSPDICWQIVAELAAGDPHVKAVRFCRNFGQHPAIAAALEHASGDRLILMDADLQDRPEDIPLLLSHLKDDVHVVYTTKRRANAGWSVQITSRLYHSLVSKALRISVPANIGTFRAFTSTCLGAIRRDRKSVV
jgi:glycosyltransferase involved in cell wall biosynthesis